MRLPFFTSAAPVGWDRATYADFVWLTSTIQTGNTFPGVSGGGVTLQALEQGRVRWCVGRIAAPPVMVL